MRWMLLLSRRRSCRRLQHIGNVAAARLVVVARPVDGRPNQVPLEQEHYKDAVALVAREAVVAALRQHKYVAGRKADSDPPVRRVAPVKVAAAVVAVPDRLVYGRAPYRRLRSCPRSQGPYMGTL